VVHICAATLEGHTEDGHGIPAETSRRVLCDAGVVPMLEDGTGAALDVGRKTRSIPSAMRRALRARDGGCRFPGCDHRRFVDAHHVEHWIDGGATELSNLITLCRRHHRYLHEWGYSMRAGDEGVEFFGPDGVRVLAQGVRPTLTPSAALELDVEVAEPGWDGWPIDYPMCIEALAS
jgi:hypothetical protein